jgi:hypothetical protein
MKAKDVICCKCNYVLDTEDHPDTGECPKCGGTMYEEGEVFSDGTIFELLRFVQSLGLIDPKNKKGKLTN